MSVFSERLIRLRKGRDLSQAAVAEEVRLSMRAYQKYEYEESEPKLSVAVRIADFYGVSLDYLAGRSEGPEQDAAALERAAEERERKEHPCRS